MEYNSIALTECDIKFSQSEGEFSGYGSVFGNIDSKNDIVMPGAFDDVLKSGDPVAVYVNHGWLRGELPIGTWNGLNQDTKGLFGNASLVMQMPTAVNAYWAAKSKLVNGLSIGFIADPATTERKTNGTRIIHRMKALKEISIVTDPSNDATRIINVKSVDFWTLLPECKTEKDIEKLLRDAGLGKWDAMAIVSTIRNIVKGRDATDESEEKNALILERINKIIK